MQQIKLRAWDIKAKCFHYSDKMTWEAFGALYMDWPNDFIISQFTGLLDANGKEIYDKDYVMSLYNGGLVRWDEEELQWWASDHALCDLTNLQVVGNIHQDQELLT